MVEGEAGIGKTTLWLAGVEQARERGFRVLSAQPAAAESVQAYASLADLLSIDPAAWAELPEPQRRAIDQVLLRTESDTPATDQRAVAAAFLSVIKRLADDSPVLLAIDDLQWLDPSSVHVLSFAVRRLTGPVGVLGARTHRYGLRDDGVVAATPPTRRHPSNPGAAAEPWRAARCALRAARSDVSAADHESHPGDLGRKPFLCNRIGAHITG